jgi:hypothetical protein
LHAQALLLVEAQRVGHDQRRRAGDGDEADLQFLEFERRLVLCHRLQRRDRQQRADRSPCRVGPHRLQEAAAHAILRQQRLDERSLDEVARVLTSVGRQRSTMPVSAVVAPAKAPRQKACRRIVGAEAIAALSHRRLPTT